MNFTLYYHAGFHGHICKAKKREKETASEAKDHLLAPEPV